MLMALERQDCPDLLITFVTRIVENFISNDRSEAYTVADYDIPENAWYFSENGAMTMPYAVLMEVALQPCGWLSTSLCQQEN